MGIGVQVVSFGVDFDMVYFDMVSTYTPVRATGLLCSVICHSRVNDLWSGQTRGARARYSDREQALLALTTDEGILRSQVARIPNMGNRRAWRQRGALLPALTGEVTAGVVSRYSI